MSNIVFDLNEAARLTPDEEERHALKAMASEIDDAIAALHDDPTTKAMIKLNGAWVRAAYLLEMATLPGDNDPTGGAMPVPMRRAA